LELESAASERAKTTLKAGAKEASLELKAEGEAAARLELSANGSVKLVLDGVAQTLTAGANESISLSAKRVVIEAEELVLKSGNATLSIGPGGITLEGSVTVRGSVRVEGALKADGCDCP